MYALGATDAFDALCYGQSHPSTLQFLQNQASFIADTVTQQGRAFLDRSRQAFEVFNGSAAIDFARKISSTVKGLFESKHIVGLWELEAMQKASITMQRWVMANPTVRKLYHEQKLDGYSDTYSDVHGTDIADSHYDYRRVMDGVMQFEDNDEWFVKEYIEDLLDGDRDLTHSEKVDIIHTWNKMDLILALGKDDPTSPVGGKL
jgi:hypothetical protein